MSNNKRKLDQMCDKCMSGSVVCISHTNRTEKVDLIHKLESMSGVYSSTVTPEVTHLVTNTVRSKKYEMAVTHGVDIVSEDWIQYCWQRCLEWKRFKATDESVVKRFRIPAFRKALATNGELLLVVKQNEDKDEDMADDEDSDTNDDDLDWIFSEDCNEFNGESQNTMSLDSNVSQSSVDDTIDDTIDEGMHWIFSEDFIECDIRSEKTLSCESNERQFATNGVMNMNSLPVEKVINSCDHKKIEIHKSLGDTLNVQMCIYWDFRLEFAGLPSQRSFHSSGVMSSLSSQRQYLSPMITINE